MAVARSVDAAGGDFNLLAAQIQRLGLVEALAADLHAGVERRMHLELQLQDEVAVILLRAEERVGRVGHGAPDDGAVLDFVVGLAAALDPAVEVLAVEERGPVVL